MNLNNICEIQKFVSTKIKKKNKRSKVYCHFCGDMLDNVAETFYLNKRSAFINLSWYYWGKISNYQKKKAIIHEICHISAYLDGDKEEHGPAWASYMRKHGYRPDVTMRIK